MSPKVTTRNGDARWGAEPESRMGATAFRSGVGALEAAAFRMSTSSRSRRAALAAGVIIGSLAGVSSTTAQGATAAAAATTDANPRFGRWKLKSDAPPPASNIMTYSPHGATGMRVLIESVNARGDTTRWGYLTEFDGRDMPVTGNAGQTHASVRRVSEFVNEIVNSKDGVVTTRLTNVLSPDGSTIAVIYMRDDGKGKTTGVSFATYERLP